MPSILLINENKIVSRLLQLSSQKNGYNFEEVSKLDTSGDSYDVIFIDSDMYSTELLEEINSKLNFNQLGYIGTKKDPVPEGFDLSIEKPFLPTDFVNLINEKVVANAAVAETLEDELLDDSKEDSLDLDGSDLQTQELLTMDDLEDDTSLDELDALDDTDLSLDPSLVMSTGIAASMAKADNDHADLAGMVSEIEDMPDEEMKILDDDLLDQPLDAPLVEEALEGKPLEELLAAEDLKDEPLEELLVEEELQDEPLEELLTQEDVQDELSIDSLEKEVDEKETEDLAAVAAGVGGVAFGAVASAVVDRADKIEFEEFDSLHESDVKDALDEKVQEVGEEIISQELVSEGEETVVESNDVEQWIRDAVSKAITPEMIMGALDDMEVTVTLNFSSKKKDDIS